jgi:hypothetical protein
MSDWLVALACAELLFLLVSSKALLICVKAKEQVSTSERLQIKQGLRRSLFLECFLFVPASSVLALIIIKPLLTKAGLLVWIGNQKSFDGILGIVSYGFPFAALRAVVTRVALGTLREFAAITKEARAKEESICPPQEILS